MIKGTGTKGTGTKMQAQRVSKSFRQNLQLIMYIYYRCNAYYCRNKGYKEDEKINIDLDSYETDEKDKQAKKYN